MRRCLRRGSLVTRRLALVIWRRSVVLWAFVMGMSVFKLREKGGDLGVGLDHGFIHFLAQRMLFFLQILLFGFQTGIGFDRRIMGCHQFLLFLGSEQRAMAAMGRSIVWRGIGGVGRMGPSGTSEGQTKNQDEMDSVHGFLYRNDRLCATIIGSTNSPGTP